MECVNSKAEKLIFVFFLVVASGAMEVHRNFAAILGYLDGTHGSELWIRNVDDSASDIYETNSSLQYQKSK